MIQIAPKREPHLERGLLRVRQCASADGTQMTVPHIRNHTQSADLLHSLLRAVDIVRGTIINGNDGQLVTLLYAFDMLEQPSTVLFADFDVAVLGLIPATIERFEGDGIHVLMYGG